MKLGSDTANDDICRSRVPDRSRFDRRDGALIGDDVFPHWD
jgi:hypothetical protein